MRRFKSFNLVVNVFLYRLLKERWHKSLRSRAPELVGTVFKALLERDPEPEALASYSDLLSQTHDLALLISNIAGSQEHWHKSLRSRAPELVGAVYQALLDRDPDTAALARYSELLSQTHDLAPLLSEIAGSQDHWHKSLASRAPELVSAAFKTLLERDPEPAALAAYSKLLSQTHDLAPLLSEIAGSQEHWHKSLNARAPELVGTAYKALLERDPDAETLDHYVATLRETHDFRALLLSLCASGEHWESQLARNSALIVRSAFEALLKRPPYAHEIIEHTTQLEDDKSVASLLQSISADQEHWEKMISANAEALVECIYQGVLKRSPESSEIAAHAPELVSLKAIASLLETLVQGVVTSEVAKATQILSAATPPVQTASATGVVNELELQNGFYSKEAPGFAWSKPQSSIKVKGSQAVYLSCNYLAPLQQRRVVVTDDDQRYEVVLEDSFTSHEILIEANNPKTIRFQADGSFSPINEGMSSDSRDLAFQLWTQRPARYPLRRPTPQMSYVIFVADEKKEIDSLNAVYVNITRHGVPTKFLDNTSAVNLVRAEVNTNHCFVISGSTTYDALANAGAQGKFIYMEHGVSPLKKYTYSGHYHRYDLALLPGELWTERLIHLYPEMTGRCKAVGYAKLQAAKQLSTEQRSAMCDKLQLDPAKPIVLFAPSWSGGNRDCGIHNLRFFNKSVNLFTIAHDGDMPFSNAFIKEGYRVCRPAKNESISDYYHLADILVSDISSTAIEFAALGKPVICISMPRIPDFEMRFREGEHQLRIPHTNQYWDFCDWSLREDINIAVEKLIAQPLTSKELKLRQKKVQNIVAHVGENAVEQSTKAIIEFLNQPMFDFSEK
jgi:CDP-Glycerol:Poly(glycerophosphate) glycerophosphotransferase